MSNLKNNGAPNIKSSVKAKPLKILVTIPQICVLGHLFLFVFTEVYRKS